MEDKNKKQETEKKINKMRDDLVDKEKCKIIAKQLTDYIKRESQKNN